MGVNKRRDITAQPCTLLLVACPPALLNDRAELLQLALRAQERTEPLLRQLPRLLVLGVPQQLHYSSLIWRETCNLPHDRAHELGARRLDTLPLAGADSLRDGSRGVTLGQAVAKIGTGHFT